MSDLATAINQTLEEAINRAAPADRLMLLLLKQHLRGALAMLETVHQRGTCKKL